jgi:hypothetical protein
MGRVAAAKARAAGRAAFPVAGLKEDACFRFSRLRVGYLVADDHFPAAVVGVLVTIVLVIIVLAAVAPVASAVPTWFVENRSWVIKKLIGKRHRPFRLQ